MAYRLIVLGQQRIDDLVKQIIVTFGVLYNIQTQIVIEFEHLIKGYLDMLGHSRCNGFDHGWVIVGSQKGCYFFCVRSLDTLFSAEID
jgi:hypothetical protein